MEQMKYVDILSKKNELRKKVNTNPLRFKVLSNITVNQLNDIAEYFFLSRGVNVVFESGNYDNIIQDAQSLTDVDGVLIFWEAANMINGLHYKINTFSEKEYEGLSERVRSEIDILIPHLSKFPMVVFNSFSSLIFNIEFQKENRFDALCNELNTYVKNKLPDHVFFTDLSKVISRISVQNAFNSREYNSSKVLYTIEFHKAYVQFTAPYILSSFGLVKKALIFDCDNTLWKGIIGEDGFAGIQMSENDKTGRPFREVQSLALELSKTGVLLGICSKNNPDDVEQVLLKHTDMVLRNEHFAIKKINWTNKADNLIAIAEDLNIGIDSLVFIDDSDFEINLVKDRLPELTTIQVPKNLHLYPEMIRQAFALFYKNRVTEEDKKKTEMYAVQEKRKEEASKFEHFEDYLRSLEIKIKIFENDPSLIARMGQMTQKTNQFNLTTKRYTESQIEAFIKDPNTDVYALQVSDKFGDSGITGLAIIKNFEAFSEVDSFLMSCRVIGRNIEYKFMDHILNRIHTPKITASYIKTKKNSQTSAFYETIGFSITENEEDRKRYELQKESFISRDLDYIKIEDERQN